MKLLFLKFFCLLITPLFCSAANATDMTIFGLSLGKELSVTECKKTFTQNEIVYESSTNIVCFERGRVHESTPIINDDNNVQTDSIYLKFPASSKPQIMADNRIFAVVVNKNLEGVVFDTEGITTTELVMKTLREKYNLPTSITPIQINRAKGKIDALRAEWHLEDLFVSFQNVNIVLETGVIYILTEKGKKWYSEQMKRMEIL